MLIVHQLLSDIEEHLLDLLIKTQIFDYRIVFHLTNEIRIYVLADSKSDIIASMPHKDHNMINYTIIAQSEKENDPYWADIFSREGPKLDKSLRRRFDNVLSEVACRPEKTLPVISFYSYKGGTGRTTTLASFASYYTIHCKKKVVILDCDFEAPGLNNFFGISDEVFAQKSGGIIEFFSDLVFNPDTDLEKYYIRVSSKYSGEGSIFVFPAGNLSQEHIDYSCNRSYTHFDAYLEALSRTNISSKEYIVKHFANMLEKISIELKPDIVLIDTRTGFNDVYANIAISFSDIMIGFFGCNAQTVPGYQWFVENCNRVEIPAITINSISSSGQYSLFLDTIHNPVITQLLSSRSHPYRINSCTTSSTNETKEVFDERNDQNSDSSILSIPTYFITNNPILASIGTAIESAENDFIALIKNKEFSDYNKLFTDLKQLIEDMFLINQKPNEHNVIMQGQIPSIEINLFDSNLDNTVSSNPRYYQEQLLNNLVNNLPNLYGEDTEVTTDFVNRCLFYRESMNDLLNKDRFLIIGNKGTGKTLLYKAFTNSSFVDILTTKFGDTSRSYDFINVIPIQSGSSAFIDNSSIRRPENISSDDFYKSFWFVLVWDIIFNSPNEFTKAIKPSLQVFPIRNDRTTAIKITDIVLDDSKMIAIESDLRELDITYGNASRKLVVLFDQLDYVFKPVEWDKAIAPLIKFWRNHQYLNIIPKIFIRSDLFKKLGNITNKDQLNKRAISIEWSKEELFGFFFKTLFSIENQKEIFFKALSESKLESAEYISELYESCSDYQIPNSEKDLKLFVECFFGKWANKEGSPKYGDCYEWFYKSLRNADLTISLRPFIDLIQLAVKDALQNCDYNKFKPIPILHQVFYTNPWTRNFAVERHIADLSKEEGNKDITKIFSYIQTDAPIEYKKFSLPKREFESLMFKILEVHGHDMENKSVDELRHLLEVNGIIYQFNKPGGYMFYSFAYLYKYYLGLKTNYSIKTQLLK